MTEFFNKTLFFFPLSILFFCQCQTKIESEGEIMPEFVITDSLFIDYLGQLNMVDFKEDQSEYLLYDRQRKEFVRVNNKGNILQTKNLSIDGKDYFGTQYFSINYLPNNQLLFVGSGHFFWYDRELNLIEKKEIPFNIKSIYFSPGHVNLVQEQRLFTHAYSKDINEASTERDEFLSSHPFLTVFDFKEEKFISQDYIPKSVQMIKSPGKYLDSAPFSLLHNEELYLLFANSPEIYRFSFPNLELMETIELNPGKSTYSQIAPLPFENYEGGTFEMVFENSAYFGLFSSNEYLLTGYYGAIPSDVMEEYNSTATQEEKTIIKEKYKIPYYQIIKEGKKLWEGHLDIQFKNQGGRLFADHKLNQPKVEEELDYIPFYFYELR
ncbi:hypothetical protein CA2015_1923 [Cyclobacterium amurskyense]|uniref:Uncharacterized protein n=2 Tax=Cyclobacterium amurskyense TaxID=320787 RepID=A0A0H4PDZ5_9BACT|nr:hypothetical protein CA2015_1923 [Cyclobacterium amurskyense]